MDENRRRPALTRADRGPRADDLAITVAVCTHNRPADLRRCLQALSTLPPAGQSIVVIDNSTLPGAMRSLVDEFTAVDYISEPRVGLNMARNRALREATPGIVAFIDDDALPANDWLQNLIANFNDPKTLCVTGQTFPLFQETAAQRWFERLSSFRRGDERVVFSRDNHDPARPGWIGAGVNMALRTDLTQLVGPFAEDLDAGTPTRSGGDYDMFSRILSAGYQIVYEPNAIAWHRHRETWPELRQTLFGYGVGASAAWTRSLIIGHNPGVLRAAGGWLLRWLMPQLISALLRRPDHIPLDLILAQLAGFLLGPSAYLISTLLQRRRQTPPAPQLNGNA